MIPVVIQWWLVPVILVGLVGEKTRFGVIQREFGEDAKNNLWSPIGFESELCHFTPL